MGHQSVARPLPVNNGATVQERLERYYYSYRHLAVDDPLVDFLKRLDRNELLALVHAYELPEGPVLDAMAALGWVELLPQPRFNESFVQSQDMLTNFYAMLRGVRGRHAQLMTGSTSTRY